MISRVKQFVKAMTAHLTETDIMFVKTYLNEQEEQLFFALQKDEQRHSIDVAIKLKEMTRGDQEMIRVGLLHDIGKQFYPLHPIQKSIMVIADRLTQGKIKKYHQVKMIKSYYEHPQLGYELLKSYSCYDEAFLQLIKSHHCSNSKENRLCALQTADNLS